MNTKQCDVIILLTDGKANIFFGSELFTHSYPNGDPIKPYGYAGRHLYIVSDEEIKEGDFAYNNVTHHVYKITNPLDEYTYLTGNNKVWYKIIASTDPQLGKHIDGDNPSIVTFIVPLPQIPQAFITLYIEEYNAGRKIEKVEVEYEESKNCFLSDQDDKDGSLSFTPYTFLKLNPDNTINIKPLKDSWTREEVLTLFDGFLTAVQEGKVETVETWIKENL